MTKPERRQWALEMAASLLQSDMDCFDAGDEDEDEQDKRREAVRQIANELQAKADRMARHRKRKGGAS